MNCPTCQMTMRSKDDLERHNKIAHKPHDHEHGYGWTCKHPGQPQHTPTPWSLLPARTLVNIKGPKGEQVGQLPIKSVDAEFIVRAVNSHEALLAFANQALTELEKVSQNGYLIQQLRSAINKASIQ